MNDFPIWTLLFLVLMVSCQVENNKEKWGKVEYVGALKNMMHKGNLSANISLQDLKDRDNIYALGAMKNLKGEIQIFNGVAYNSLVDKDSLVIDNSFEKEATLLVYAQVNDWTSINIPSSITTRQSLEHFILQQAKADGIDTKTPFPFLLEGTFKSLEWHVINWKEGDKEHSHEKHIQSGLYGTLHDTSAQMLGFYSKKHKGVFTHHTANTHIHFLLNDKKVSGHVDHLEISNDVVLQLPKLSIK